MKNTLLISFAVLFMNGFVYSQGIPESVVFSKRTIVKDTLGNTLKSNEYTNYLNKDGWILQSEKNEQGKEIYMLLRKTTNAEKEILSNNSVVEFKNEDAKSVKKGKFTIQSKDGEEISIRRRRNKQIECSVNADGDKVKTKYRIVWSDDNSYRLIPMGKQMEANSKELRYKILEITDKYYIARIVGENYLGGMVKVSFND